MLRSPKYTAVMTGVAAVMFLCAGTLSAGQSPLRKAVKNGDIVKTRELLEKGADINEWKNGCSILMEAAWKGDLKMAELLIEKGANMNASAEGGWSALAYAARQQNPQMVDLLLVKGADMDLAVKGMAHWAEYLAKGPYPNKVEADKVKNGLSFLKGRAGAAYYQAKQYDKAVKVLAAAVNSDPRNADNLVGLAFCQLALGKFGDAKISAGMAVKLAPDNSEANLALADALMNLGESKAALEPLQTAARLNPKNPWVFNRLGNACFNLKDYAASLDNFRKAAELAPGQPVPQMGVMNLCVRTGLYDEAIAAAGRVLEIKDNGQDLVYIHGLRSLLLSRKGLLEEAAGEAEKAASLDAAHEWSKLATSALAMKRGDYASAFKELESVKTGRSSLVDILTAEACARLGNTADAERLFAPVGGDTTSDANRLVADSAKTVVELLKPAAQAHLDLAGKLAAGPEYPQALDEYAKALRLVEAAGAGDIRGKVSAILKAHRELLELPEGSRKLMLQADVLLGEKKDAEALKKYKAAIELSPFSPDLHHKAALIAADIKEYSEALDRMKAYLELLPDAADAREARDLMYKWEFMKDRGTEQK